MLSSAGAERQILHPERCFENEQVEIDLGWRGGKSSKGIGRKRPCCGSRSLAFRMA